MTTYKITMEVEADPQAVYHGQMCGVADGIKFIQGKTVEQFIANPMSVVKELLYNDCEEYMDDWDAAWEIAKGLNRRRIA